jgi:DNA-binding Lrp family transcriptional regulator
MSVAEVVEGNVNSRTVQLVKLLAEVGPDIPEISRRLGQFKESVRYRYKEKILSRGFAVQAAVDHERLGLRRVVLMVDFADPYKNYAQSIFSAMNELTYLSSFARELTGTRYLVTLSVPTALEDKIVRFYESLKEKGMFTSVDVMSFDWLRTVPMKAEYYDFDSGRWDFDWSESSSTDKQAAVHTPSERVRFDYTDLLILKELQMDANKSLKEISDNLGINYKKLAWHYNAHVKGKDLIRGYMINWMGTRYDYALEKALHRKHKYFAIDVLVRDVNEYEMMLLRQDMSRLPFVWAEAAGKNYFAMVFLPVDFVVEGLQYLGRVTTAVKDRVILCPLDHTDALTFTISYKLYDAVRKEWKFEELELAKSFEDLIVQIKTNSG